MKRALDIFLSSFGLIIVSPILLPMMFIIYWNDKHSPFYIAPRMGRGKKPFKMIKLRSMRINADKTGVDSTSANDNRITSVGKFVRRYKLDELPQLINVLKGEMSLVGPRPNLKRDVELYTAEEFHLLDVRPGITDISSIVFSDEGEILKNAKDPDLDYDQRIRPWKSRLGLLYVKHTSLLLDIRLIFLTVLAILNRKRALVGVEKLLHMLHADEKICRVSRRFEPLLPYPPPGASEIILSRG